MIDVAKLRNQGKTIPAKDLSKFMLPIRNQCPIGACAGFAVASIFEYYLFRKDGVVKKEHRRSPTFMYWVFRGPDQEPYCSESAGKDDHNKKDKDCGSRYPAYMRKIVSRGCCSESAWPFDNDKRSIEGYPRCKSGRFTETPDEDAFRDAAENKLFTTNWKQLMYDRPYDWVQEIHNGNVLLLGITRYPEGFNDDDGPELFDESFSYRNGGGHAMVIVGYHPNYKDTGKEVFKVRNSWGEDWKDQGYCYFTINALKQCASVVTVFDAKEVKPLPGPPEPEPAPHVPTPAPPPRPLTVTINTPANDEPDEEAVREVGDNTPMEVSGDVDGPRAAYDYIFGIYNTDGKLVAKLDCADNENAGSDFRFNIDFTQAPLANGTVGQLPAGGYEIYLWAQIPGTGNVVAPVDLNNIPTSLHIAPPARRKIRINESTPVPPTPVSDGEYNYVWWLFDSEGELGHAQENGISPMDLYSNSVGRRLDGPIKPIDGDTDFSDVDMTIGSPADINKIVALGACDTMHPEVWKWDAIERRCVPRTPRVQPAPKNVSGLSDAERRSTVTGAPAASTDSTTTTTPERESTEGDPTVLRIDLADFQETELPGKTEYRVENYKNYRGVVVYENGTDLHQVVDLSKVEKNPGSILRQDQKGSLSFEIKDDVLVIQHKDLQVIEEETKEMIVGWLKDKKIITLDEEIDHKIKEEISLIEDVWKKVHGIADALDRADKTHKIFTKAIEAEKSHAVVLSLAMEINQIISDLDVSKLKKRESYLIGSHKELMHALNEYKNMTEELDVPQQNRKKWDELCEKAFLDIEEIIIRRDSNHSMVVTNLAQLYDFFEQIYPYLEQVARELETGKKLPNVAGAVQMLTTLLQNFKQLHRDLNHLKLAVDELLHYTKQMEHVKQIIDGLKIELRELQTLVKL